MTQLFPNAAPLWTITAVSYDSPAACDLTRALYREQSETYGTADDPAATATAEFEPPHGLFLIARTGDGTAIACGGWRTAGPATAEIKRMFVSLPARGEGLGRHLLAALEHDARQHGLTRLILETGVDNQAALALYARCGYTYIHPYVPGRDPRINRALSKALNPAPARIHTHEVSAHTRS